MLFVYGTLQDPDVLGAVLGRRVDGAMLRVARAPGYRAVAYPGRVYPALVALPGEAAPGLVLDGLSVLDMAVLDAFEGDEYRRMPLTIERDGCLAVADAYMPVASISAAAPAWSLADWTARHKPVVLGSETGAARSLRERLSAQVPG